MKLLIKFQSVHLLFLLSTSALASRLSLSTSFWNVSVGDWFQDQTIIMIIAKKAAIWTQTSALRMVSKVGSMFEPRSITSLKILIYFQQLLIISMKIETKKDSTSEFQIISPPKSAAPGRDKQAFNLLQKKKSDALLEQASKNQEKGRKPDAAVPTPKFTQPQEFKNLKMKTSIKDISPQPRDPNHKQNLLNPKRASQADLQQASIISSMMFKQANNRESQEQMQPQTVSQLFEQTQPTLQRNFFKGLSSQQFASHTMLKQSVQNRLTVRDPQDIDVRGSTTKVRQVNLPPENDEEEALQELPESFEDSKPPTILEIERKNSPTSAAKLRKSRSQNEQPANQKMFQHNLNIMQAQAKEKVTVAGLSGSLSMQDSNLAQEQNKIKAKELIKKNENRDQKQISNREMKQRTQEILGNGKKVKREQDARNYIMQKQQEALNQYAHQAGKGTQKTPLKQSHDVTEISKPFAVLNGNVKGQLQRQMSSIKDAEEQGMTPPSSHHKKLIQAVNKVNFDRKTIRRVNTGRETSKEEAMRVFNLISDSKDGITSSIGVPHHSQFSQNHVPIETRPDLRNRLFQQNILTENSSYEREKRKIKAELQDSRIYFLKDLKDEIEKEERYSQCLPRKTAPDYSSFVQSQIIVDSKKPHSNVSDKSSADLDLSISDHITIPGLDTYDVLNTELDSFLGALEQTSKGKAFDPIKPDQQAFRESLLLKTQEEVGFMAMQKQIERAREWGQWLQQRIFQAKGNEIIQLPCEIFRFTSLHIDQPVRLIGQAGTIFEVDGGSIFIDFNRISETGEDRSATYGDLSTRKNGQSTPLTIKKSKVAMISEIEIVFNRTKASHYMLSKQLDDISQTDAQEKPEREQTILNEQSEFELGQGPLSHTRTTNNLNIQLKDQIQIMRDTSPAQNLNALSIQQQTTQNNLFRRQLDNKLKLQKQSNVISCFVIEHESFIEIRDCSIKSVNDKTVFDKALDSYIMQMLMKPQQSKSSMRLTLTEIQNGEVPRVNDKMRNQINESIKNDFVEKMRLKDNQINDYCFVLNFPSLHQKNQNALITSNEGYSGLASLCSTTISYFQYGVYCGRDAILTCDQSSFISLRHGYAVFCQYPKLVKIINGSIQKCEAGGIFIETEDQQNINQNQGDPIQTEEVYKGLTTEQYNFETYAYAEPLKTELSRASRNKPNEDQDPAANLRKIYIESNRFVQVQGTAIHIEGTGRYQQFLIRIKDNRVQNCGLESKLYSIPAASKDELKVEKELINQAYQRMGGIPQACVLVRNLYLYNLTISRNTISKGSGAGIKLFNVKGCSKNMNGIFELPKNETDAEQILERCSGNLDRVELIDNYVIDTVEGYGIVVDSSSCKLEQNQVKKNSLGGLLITTTVNIPLVAKPNAQSIYLESETQSVIRKNFSKLDQVRSFCQVSVDSLTAYQNNKFGVAVRCLYGLACIQNSSCNENEGHGILLASKPSNKIQLLQGTDNNQSLANGPTLRQVSTLQRIDPGFNQKNEDFMESQKRPFDILINQCIFLKCIMSQNRKDGIKSKDYKCQILGCKIQGNLGNALTMCQQNVAEASLYLKSKSNESDLIGRLIGHNGVRYRPRIVLQQNLLSFCNQMKAMQIKQLYDEMIYLGQEQMLTNQDNRLDLHGQSIETNSCNGRSAKKSFETEKKVTNRTRSPIFACFSCFAPKNNKESNGPVLRSARSPEATSKIGLFLEKK